MYFNSKSIFSLVLPKKNIFNGANYEQKTIERLGISANPEESKLTPINTNLVGHLKELQGSLPETFVSNEQLIEYLRVGSEKAALFVFAPSSLFKTASGVFTNSVFFKDGVNHPGPNGTGRERAENHALLLLDMLKADVSNFWTFVQSDTKPAGIEVSFAEKAQESIFTQLKNKVNEAKNIVAYHFNPDNTEHLSLHTKDTAEEMAVASQAANSIDPNIITVCCTDMHHYLRQLFFGELMMMVQGVNFDKEALSKRFYDSFIAFINWGAKDGEYNYLLEATKNQQVIDKIYGDKEPVRRVTADIVSALLRDRKLFEDVLKNLLTEKNYQVIYDSLKKNCYTNKNLESHPSMEQEIYSDEPAEIYFHIEPSKASYDEAHQSKIEEMITSTEYLELFIESLKGIFDACMHIYYSPCDNTKLTECEGLLVLLKRHLRVVDRFGEKSLKAEESRANILNELENTKKFFHGFNEIYYNYELPNKS